MWSLSEVGALVQKAARGAGIPLGQAEDLGQVAVYLAGTGGDVTLITQALEEPIGAVDVHWHAEWLEVRAGPAALIAPIVRDAFQMGFDYVVLIEPLQSDLIIAYLAQSGMNATQTADAIKRGAVAAPQKPVGPVEIPDTDWTLWEKLAAKTYVPESTASRVAGAGAGLTDND